MKTMYNDPRAIRLRLKLGLEGYGIYVIIMEMLSKESAMTMPLYYEIIRHETRARRKTIKSILEDFGLFRVTEDGFLCSDDVLFFSRKRLKEKKKDEKEEKEEKEEKKESNKENKEEKEVREEKEKEENEIINIEDNFSQNYSYIYKEKENKKEKERDIEQLNSEKAEKNGRRLKDARERFEYEIMQYAGTYGEDMLRDFIGYWTEPNKSVTRMRFELERTWDTGRRLGTWDRNRGRYEQDRPDNLRTRGGREADAASIVERMQSCDDEGLRAARDRDESDRRSILDMLNGTKAEE